MASCVQKYFRIMGLAVSECGVIQSNPAKSKHLETATLRIMGQSVDFVNLRSETYSEHTRIPEIVWFVLIE